MDSETKLFLTRFGYAFFPLGAVLCSAYLIKWLRADYLTETTKMFVLIFLAIMWDIGIRVGWFTVSRATAPNGALQNPWMWDNKVYMALGTGVLFFGLVMAFINLIENYKTIGIIRDLVLVVLAALFLATV